jgi:hypothetical protein
MLLLTNSLQALKMADAYQDSTLNSTSSLVPTPFPAFHDLTAIACTNAFPTHQNSASPLTNADIPNTPIPLTSTPTIPRLRHITLPDIVSGLERRLFTSAGLVDTYLARIREIDYKFRSTVQVSPIAIACAHALDAENGRRGSLHGVPILLKDNTPTLDDGTETTCGSMALGKFPPAYNNTCVPPGWLSTAFSCLSNDLISA